MEIIGLYGNGLTTTKADIIAGNNLYLHLAEKAAINVVENSSGIADLCCGLAGAAYSLLNLYKYSSEQ